MEFHLKKACAIVVCDRVNHIVWIVVVVASRYAMTTSVEYIKSRQPTMTTMLNDNDPTLLEKFHTIATAAAAVRRQRGGEGRKKKERKKKIDCRRRHITTKEKMRSFHFLFLCVAIASLASTVYCIDDDAMGEPLLLLFRSFLLLLLLLHIYFMSIKYSPDSLRDCP